MSIYRARLRNTSNALSPRVSCEQIRLQVPPKLFGVDSWIDNRAVNSKLLVWLQKKHGSQRCRVELVELTVDDCKPTERLVAQVTWLDVKDG